MAPTALRSVDQCPKGVRGERRDILPGEILYVAGDNVVRPDPKGREELDCVFKVIEPVVNGLVQRSMSELSRSAARKRRLRPRAADPCG